MGKKAKKTEKDEKKGGNKAKRTITNIILVILLGVIAFSGWKIYNIMSAYSADRNSYDEISQAAQQGVFNGEIDFDALKEINPDVVGWVYLKGTNIDYPIVKAYDNSKYLHTLFNGNAGGAGTLFTDAGTMDPFNQFSTVVYGHNMNDGSMFHNLRKFKDPDFVKDHGTFDLILLDGKYHLEVYAFLNVASDSGIYRINVDGEDECQKFINLINSQASYVANMTLTPEDRIVLLSTCAYEFDNARYVIVGKMVPWEEQK